MQQDSNNKNTLQSRVLWLAVTALIVLSAGYAAMSRTPSRSTTPITTQPELQQTIAPLNHPEPVPARLPIATVKAAKPRVEVAASKAQPPSETPSARKSSCNCETAELELPDLCPDASCHQCKVKCGILSH